MNIKELGIQHVAIIMDGNGRWATEKNLDRTAGHAAGEHALSKDLAAQARCHTSPSAGHSDSSHSQTTQ